VSLNILSNLPNNDMCWKVFVVSFPFSSSLSAEYSGDTKLRLFFFSPGFPSDVDVDVDVDC
jgi:hypothetical protein